MNDIIKNIPLIVGIPLGVVLGLRLSQIILGQ